MEDPRSLIEQEIPRLRRYARYLARNADTADDLVQEALTRAIANIHRWQPGSNMRAWLFVILRNTFINEIRRNKRSNLAGELTHDHPALAVTGGQEARMRMVELDRAFNALADDHREILLLVVIEGLTYEHAAEILEVPVGTVRSRLSRARAMLRELMEETPEEPAAADEVD